MTPIQHSLTSFTDHLKRNISISCSKTSWKVDSQREIYKKKIYQWLHCNRNNHLEPIGKCFLTAIDLLESSPVLFYPNNISPNPQFYSEYFRAAKVVKKLLKSSQSNLNIKQLNELSVKITALKYRLEACNGGLDPIKQLDPVLYEKIKQSAQDWKNGQHLYNEKALTEKDLLKIKQICLYPKFAKLLLRDRRLNQDFFNWALQNNNGISQYVQFPNSCKLLKTSFIASRLNNFCGEALSIKKFPKEDGTPNVQEKILQLPFYNGTTTEKISILDLSREVTLNLGWKLSIKKIFDIFAKKKQDAGNVEFLGVNGIMNWNTRKLGSWHPQTRTFSVIDIDDSEWISRLPLSSIKSSKEVEEYYSIAMKQSEWLFVYRAAREHTDLSLGKRHGFLEIGIPSKDEKKYAFYPFGIYPDNFPVNIKESIASIDATSNGTIVYPDDNISYSHRQHAMLAKPISLEEGVKVIESIRQDLQKSLKKNLIFQPRWKNCAQWVQKTAKVIESCKAINPYKISITKMTAFAFISKFKKSHQDVIISALDTLLYDKRGLTVDENGKKIFKSISLIPTHEKKFTFQPGWLHEQIHAGTLPGKIFTGHQ